MSLSLWKVLPALRYVVSLGPDAVNALSARRFLESAVNSGDNMLFYTGELANAVVLFWLFVRFFRLSFLQGALSDCVLKDGSVELCERVLHFSTFFFTTIPHSTFFFLSICVLIWFFPPVTKSWKLSSHLFFTLNLVIGIDQLNCVSECFISLPFFFLQQSLTLLSFLFFLSMF